MSRRWSLAALSPLALKGIDVAMQIVRIENTFTKRVNPIFAANQIDALSSWLRFFDLKQKRLRVLVNTSCLLRG
nr:hypothetical protein [Vibrio sp. SG41-7]